MSNFSDMTGMRFGKWLVLAYIGNSMWSCLCDCGNICCIRASTLKNGTSTQCKSCRTSQVNKVSKVGNKNNVSHGESKSRLYAIWCGMISRCENMNDTGFYNYGARGIKMCEEWRLDFLRFKEWSNSNGYSDNLTIDRIDGNGNYCPDNCRWITNAEQQCNKRTNRFITLGSETKTLSQWSRQTGIKAKTIAERIRLGWSIDDAMTVWTPRMIRSIAERSDAK